MACPLDRNPMITRPEDLDAAAVERRLASYEDLVAPTFAAWSADGLPHLIVRNEGSADKLARAATEILALAG